jgi:hypothetical protein
MHGLSRFVYRLMRAAALDPTLYEEVEADSTTTPQAAAAVVLASLAAGIGAGGWRGASLTTFALFSVVALLLWVAWALLVLRIGGRLLPEPQTNATAGQLLRTIGFAAAPGLLQIFAMFPNVTAIVFGVSAAWMLAAMVVAVRHALDYRSTAHAIGVCVLAWAITIGLPLTAAILFTRTAS